MDLEGLDHVFVCIATVHVGGDKLEGCLPFFLNLEFVCDAVFVV